MSKISLMAVFWVCHCVVYGQFPFNNFDPHRPFYIPYTSTFVNQPNQQNYQGTADGKDELPDRNNYLSSVTILLKIRQLEATTESLTKQLQETKDKLERTNADLAKKAKQADLVKTNRAVSDLNTALQTTNDDLATKASQAELDQTKSEVSDLKAPKSIDQIPTSCEDLKTIGFVKSGIYSVVADKQVKNVYCDFTKSDADFQKLIGYVNVKSTAVYFYAQRDGNYDVVDRSIPFNKILVNEGKALDVSTGEFLAPAPGKYFFAYSGLCWDGEAKIQLQTKTSTEWTKIGDAHCTTFNALAIQSTLQLAKGDQVRISLTLGITHDKDGNNFSNYVGWLLEEDFV